MLEIIATITQVARKVAHLQVAVGDYEPTTDEYRASRYRMRHVRRHIRKANEHLIQAVAAALRIENDKAE